MKKWYAPSLLLLAVCTSSFTGCARTGQWISHWTGKESAERQLAEVDGKAAKAAKAKPRDEARIADSSGAKSTPSSDDKAMASTSKSKSADRADSSKSVTKPSTGTSVASATQHKPSTSKASAPRLSPDPEDPFEMADLAPPSFKRDAVATPSEQPVAHKASVDAPPLIARVQTKPAESAESPIQAISHSKPLEDLPLWARGSAAPPKAEPKPEAAPAADSVQQAAASQLQPGRPVAAKSQTKSAKFASMCPDAQGEVREIIQQLDSSDTETVKRAIHRLGRMQTHAASAAPALRFQLNDQNDFIRVHAALALVRMQQMCPEVTDTLIVGLRSADPAVRSFAAAVVAELGPDSADALPALSAALEDRDGYVRLHVAEVLIRHEAWSYRALATLTDCLEDKDENVRWLATYSLAELAPQSPDAVTALVAALQYPVEKVQTGAAYALGEIGPLAQSAESALRRATNGSSAELRTAAESALEQIRQ
jgi:HEAT repeat protein